MRNIIKIATSITLCIVLTFSAFSSYAFNDVQNAGMQNEIDVISSYGIMVGYEDGNFYPDKPVTRAEIVAVALRMKQLDSPASKNASVQTFSDVPPQHWAYAAIEMANALGIVSGYPDGTFLPNKNVTYQEAMKIFVSVLGYDVLASLKGGYPQGYIQIATQERLISLQGVSYTDSATRGAIAVMAYNTLQSKMVTETYYGNGEPRYTVSDSTMLETYFKTSNSAGIVTATRVEGLYGTETADNKIEIDNVAYKCNLDYSDLLGCKVKFFYKENSDGINEIVSIVEDTNHQNKLKINSDVLEAFTGVYTSNGSMTYYTNRNHSKIKTAKLSSGLSLIYNNEYIAYDNLGSISLDVKSGTIELIDNDEDEKYDVVKILEYKDYYVNNITENTDKKYIIDGTGAGLVYDIDEVYEKITMNGAVIGFNEIPRGSIVSAAVSSDKSVVVMTVSQKEIEGTVESKSTEGGVSYIWINGAEYVLSPASPSGYLNTQLGSSGVFKLNSVGQVAYFTATGDNGERYGYLSKLYNVEDGIISVMMLTEDNKFVTLEVADKVRVYEEGVSQQLTEKEFYDKFHHTPTFDDTRQAITQVVKYKLNDKGELSLMRTAKSTPSTDEFSVAYVNPVSGEAEGRRYYSNRLFMQNYQITDETVCFDIPWTLAGEDYTRYTSGKAVEYFGDGNYYQVLLFDANEQNQLGAVMYTRYGQDEEFLYTVSGNSPVMIVDKTRYAVDEETGDMHTIISGLVDGEYTSQIIDEEYYKTMDPDATKFGSVIQYGDNSAMVDAAYYEGQKPALVAHTTLCVDNKTSKTVKWNGGNVEMTSAVRKTTYGTVNKVNGFTVTVNVPDYKYGADTNYMVNYFMSESERVIIVNAEDRTLKIGNFYDILPGDRIFIRQRYNRIKDVVIYR